MDFHKTKENVTVTVQFRSFNVREICHGEEIAWYAFGDIVLRNEYNPSIAYAYVPRLGFDEFSQRLCRSVFALCTYDFELDSNITRGRLQTQFVSEFGYQIGRSAVLQDPNGNQIELLVEKEYGDFFFEEGWMSLLNFYKLIVGAWLTISYCCNGLFFIRVINRSRIEIKYIKYTPPLIQNFHKSQLMRLHLLDLPFLITHG